MHKPHRVSLPWTWTAPFIILGVCFGIGTEWFIGTIPAPECGISDRLQLWTLPINAFFKAHTSLANAVLITTSLWFDFGCLYLMSHSISGHTTGPYLKLFLFITLRQLMQLFVALPLPPDIIWRYPGFPSLFVRYGISNDLYFSAHTGIGLLTAMELAMLGKRWLTILGYAFFTYLVLTVIVFQIHYTMDVFTAILTVYFVRFLSNKWAPYIDHFLRFLEKKHS